MLKKRTVNFPLSPRVEPVVNLRKPRFWIILVAGCLVLFWIENGMTIQSGIRAQLDVPGSKNHEEVLEQLQPQYHISHVFNTYPVKKGSTDEMELDLVLASWRKAAEYARDSMGITVEFIEVVLEQDVDSVPRKDWATREVLKEYIKEPIKGRYMPTIGSIFSTGQLVAQSDWLLYTNIDIGATKEFYNRMYAEANQNPCDATVQERVLQKTLAFLTYCLSRPKPRTDQCVADTKEYFKDAGGVELFFDEDRVIRDLAMLYTTQRALQYSKNSKRQQFPSDKQLSTWYTLAGGAALLANEDVKLIPSWKTSPHSCEEAGIDPVTLIGGITFTRVDITAEPASIAGLGVEDAVEVIKQKSISQGAAHPGNDCFFLARENIPEMILKWSHPLSFPKWGKWFRLAYEWNQIPFRRVVSSPENILTFHLGSSGAAALHWVDFFVKHPMFFMFLQANWYKVSDSRAMSLFTDLPPWCSELVNFRGGTDRFCRNAPHPGYCNGGRRLSCQIYQHAQMIDTVRYTSFCTQKSKQQDVLPEPVCEFCNSFLDATVFSGQANKIPCREGFVSEECEHTRCDY